MIVQRGYHDFSENEEWLNEMALDGKAMNDCKIGIFTDTFSFEKCEPGEYIFRILVLENNHEHPKSMKYLRFLREGGVEHVGSNSNVVYLRKKAADGEFDVYTDRASHMKFHRRLVWEYCAVLLIFPVMLALGAASLVFGIVSDTAAQWVNEGLWIGIGSGMIGSTLVGLPTEIKYFRALRHHRRALKKLRQESVLYE